jgi:hypothetical protein
MRWPGNASAVTPAAVKAEPVPTPIRRYIDTTGLPDISPVTGKPCSLSVKP